MAGSFTVNNGTTTVTLEWTANTANVQAWVGDAAEYLYNTGWRAPSSPGTAFDTWTNQQKLDLVDYYVKEDILAKAKGLYVSSAADDAAATAETETETRYL